MNNSAHVIQFSESSREIREKRHRKLCNFYMRGLMLFLVGLAFYVLSGWFIKWMWYYNRPYMFKFMIFDLEQLSGAFFCTWIALGVFAFVRFYCPFCTKYSDYETRYKPSEKTKFWCYQLVAIVYILGFLGAVELMSFVFVSA